MRGVEDSCKMTGGWKKEKRFGDTHLISWRRGGFENMSAMMKTLQRERDEGPGPRICQSDSTQYVPSSWKLSNEGFWSAVGRGRFMYFVQY